MPVYVRRNGLLVPAPARVARLPISTRRSMAVRSPLLPHRRPYCRAHASMFMATHLIGFGGGGRYSVAFSGDWERGDSDDMTITFAGAGNRKRWTFSTWVYLESNGQRMGLIGVDNSNPDYFEIRSDNKFQFFLNNGADASVVSSDTLSTGVWYHLMCVFNSPDGTAANRIKLYKGQLGTQATEAAYSSTTYPSVDYQSQINSAAQHQLGDSSLVGVGGGSNYFDGLQAETAFVNDQALGPESFAAGGYPIDLSNLTFGTNGSWLKYANSGALGTDSSGNGNNWTNSGVAQSTTTPTS